MNSTPSSSVGFCNRGSAGQFASAILMALTVAGAILLESFIKFLSAPAKALILLVPLGCGAAYVYFVLRDMRRLDELQLRVQLEAAAVGCLGTFVIMLLYPAVQYAGFVGQLRPVYVVFVLIGCIGLGYANAVRRYR
jgi:hypothetical protein